MLIATSEKFYVSRQPEPAFNKRAWFVHKHLKLPSEVTDGLRVDGKLRWAIEL